MEQSWSLKFWAMIDAFILKFTWSTKQVSHDIKIFTPIPSCMNLCFIKLWSCRTFILLKIREKYNVYTLKGGGDKLTYVDNAFCHLHRFPTYNHWRSTNVAYVFSKNTGRVIRLQRRTPKKCIRKWPRHRLLRSKRALSSKKFLNKNIFF